MFHTWILCSGTWLYRVSRCSHCPNPWFGWRLPLFQFVSGWASMHDFRSETNSSHDIHSMTCDRLKINILRHPFGTMFSEITKSISYDTCLPCVCYFHIFEIVNAIYNSVTAYHMWFHIKIWKVNTFPMPVYISNENYRRLHNCFLADWCSQLGIANADLMSGCFYCWNTVLIKYISS